MTVRLHTDGASKGNPGPAGIGYVITDPDGGELVSVSEAIGQTTNNVAEYTALLRGLERCRELGADRVEVRSDSELMIRQMTGRYKVRNPHLRPLYERAVAAAAGFAKVQFRHVPREQNHQADGLASRAALGRPE